MHAIPVDTAPSHPPRAVSLLDPRRFNELPQLPPEPPKHKIAITFLHGKPTRRVCLDPLIKKELTLIFKEYRRQLNTDRRHGGTIHQNLHDGWVGIVTYAMRNRVLSESGHPVPVPNGRSCNVM
ncbi:hypothetical protein GGU10DRAFT_436281 [Lentinula aff. detonsa]|uniref:Uncharacterized protein n=1 Tax=Lentinula aff. detonsa TaxID=2804958 RepID=A0AA38KQA8_9AGAR|nr:hypothetical protein GGU10DRAFT_436281 [Lentinula aff. detonsa]